MSTGRGKGKGIVRSPPSTIRGRSRITSRTGEGTTASPAVVKRYDDTDGPPVQMCDPACCGPPPSDIYLPCSDVKKKVNYGSRPPVAPREACEHIQVSNPGCEKCCKTITINKYILSLHCGWHHDCLRCSWCKATLDDDHKIFRGLPYCNKCHTRLRGDHASEMRSVHRR